MEKLEFKGTKTPWVLHENVNENGRHLFTVCNEGYNNENTDFIIQKSTIIEVETLKANMQLASSAPDLLEALCQIQFAVKTGATTGLFKDEIEAMNKAIEKALK